MMARSTSPFIPIGAQVDAPRGYADMCRDRPVLCVDGRRLAANGGTTPASSKPSEATTPAVAPPMDVTGALDGPPTPQTAVLATSATSSSQTRKPWMDAAGVGAGPKMTAAVFTDGPPVTIEGRRLAFSTRLRMLEAVDRYVNGNVRQATDMEVYGVQEYWNRSGVGPGARGDCEDLAIEKRLELIDQGYPPADLVYAVVYRRDIGLHAVLVAHTELGDLVLDSLSSEIVLWSHTPYTWVKRQSVDDPSVWNLVDMMPTEQSKVRVATAEVESPAIARLGASQGAR